MIHLIGHGCSVTKNELSIASSIVIPTPLLNSRIYWRMRR